MGWRVRVALILIAALLVLGAAFPVEPLRDAATLAPPPDAALRETAAYLLLAPVWRFLDTLTLLAVSQHVATVVTALALFVVWRVLRERRPLEGLRRTLLEAGAVALFFGCLLGVYGAAAFLPHPTPQLTLSDPDLVRIDFHSHTGHSRDAAARYTVEWNRDWHRRTGFDVAYVSDHSSWAGIPLAAASNPGRAGEDVVLLSGAEAWFKGDHAIALGDSTRYISTFDSTRWRFEPDSMRSQLSAPLRTFVIALPLRHFDRVLGLTPETRDGALGIEINDGSPNGLEQSRRDRARVVGVADKFNLALVSGSNTHGTGQVAAAWTLMRIPGWREMSPDRLQAEIDRSLHAERRNATRVIERTMPYAPTKVGMALTVPSLLWHVARSMGWSERAVWLLFVGALLTLSVRPSLRTWN